MNRAEQQARIIWDYMQLHQPVSACVSCMIVLGSRDDRVAIYAAELLKANVRAEQVIVTGGVAHQNDLLAPPRWQEGSEAAHFAAVMRERGYDGPLLIEDKATNTGQNAIFSALLAESSGADVPQSLLVITKPYMERRALRTFEKQWPFGTPRFYVGSQGGSLDDYVSALQPFDDVVNIMIGDLYRLMTYPAQGFMVSSRMPRAVKAAYEALIQAGYVKHL